MHNNIIIISCLYIYFVGKAGNPVISGNVMAKLAMTENRWQSWNFPTLTAHFWQSWKFLTKSFQLCQQCLLAKLETLSFPEMSWQSWNCMPQKINFFVVQNLPIIWHFGGNGCLKQNQSILKVVEFWSWQFMAKKQEMSWQSWNFLPLKINFFLFKICL